jgi:hypothetical protein
MLAGKYEYMDEDMGLMVLYCFPVVFSCACLLRWCTSAGVTLYFFHYRKKCLRENEAPALHRIYKQGLA